MKLYFVVVKTVHMSFERTAGTDNGVCFSFSPLSDVVLTGGDHLREVAFEYGEQKVTGVICTSVKNDVEHFCGDNGPESALGLVNP